MATIKLTGLSYFEQNLKNTNLGRINSLGLTQLFYDNSYIPVLIISDKNNDSLFLFDGDGTLYGTSPSKEIKDLKGFKDLGIQTINGKTNYSPELSWVDTTCNNKVYVLDVKFNSKDNTQHVVKYNYPQYDPNNPKKKSPLDLDDIFAQIDNQKIYHFAVSESRSYDPGYGGYPLIFYAINDKKEVLEFETKDYSNKVFANPQSLVWKLTNFTQKEGFVRLTENISYWGCKEELIYTFSLEKNPSGSSFFLELINSSSLQPGSPAHSITHQIPSQIRLDFGNHIDFNLPILPKFDSASYLDDKEFLITMIPVVNGVLDNTHRDIYWFKLKGGKDEAIVLADPYRITNIDRFDSTNNCESTTCIRYMNQHLTSEDIIYLVTGQHTIKKFKLELEP